MHKHGLFGAGLPLDARWAHVTDGMNVLYGYKATTPFSLMRKVDGKWDKESTSSCCRRLMRVIEFVSDALSMIWG